MLLLYPFFDTDPLLAPPISPIQTKAVMDEEILHVWAFLPAMRKMMISMMAMRQ